MPYNGNSWAMITKDYIDKPRVLGKMDCVTIVFDIMSRRGKLMPEKFEEFTFDGYRKQYQDLWLRDPRKAMATYFRFLRYFCDQIKKHEARSGDILIIKYKTEHSVGVLTGNGRIIAVFEMYGVKVIPNEFVTITKAYRWKNREES